MRKRDKLALTLPPLLLRAALGVTFLWAGLGKVVETFPASPQKAAILANLNAIPGPAGAVQQTPPTPDAEPLPEPDPASEPAVDEPAPQGGADAGPADSNSAFILVQQNSFAAEDFPETTDVKRVHFITLIIYNAAHPGFDEETGEPLKPFVPDALGSGQWPVILAWAAAATEILGGLLVLVGLLTRLGSLGLAFTMGTAIWLTILGPAIQSGDTFLGFLPNQPFFSDYWQHAMWLLLLLASSLAVMLSGSGALSIDRIVFSPQKSKPPRHEPDDDDE